MEFVRQVVESDEKKMKVLNDYMEMSYRIEIVEDKDEGGYVVSYPDLPGCSSILLVVKQLKLPCKCIRRKEGVD